MFNNQTKTIKFNAKATDPGNDWHDNGSEASDDVKNNAGLEEEFKYLLKVTEH